MRVKQWGGRLFLPFLAKEKKREKETKIGNKSLKACRMLKGYSYELKRVSKTTIDPYGKKSEEK